MSTHFDPKGRAVVVEAELIGPARTIAVKMALDTGATLTSVRPRFLRAAGYDPARADRLVTMRSATGEALVPEIPVSRFEVLDRTQTRFPIIAHELPRGVTVDGLLGLDFFRGLVLTVDFAAGRVSLRPPRAWWQFWR